LHHLFKIVYLDLLAAHGPFELLYAGLEFFHLLVAAVLHFYNSESFLVKGREFIDPTVNRPVADSVEPLQLEYAKLAAFKIGNDPFFKFKRVFTLLADTPYICFHGFSRFKWSTYIRDVHESRPTTHKSTNHEPVMLSA